MMFRYSRGFETQSVYKRCEEMLNTK